MSQSSPAPRPPVIGVDLGGTSVEVGLLTADGTLHGVERFDTRSYRPRDAVVADLIRAVRAAAAAASERGQAVAALGVGVPATLDAEGARTLVVPNFAEGWSGFPLADALAEGAGLPTALINDARAFVLAESRLGAGRGCRHVFGIILGTGIGGGAVLDGRLHLGYGGLAGELGHHIVDPHGPRCGCGSRGCLETLASAPALVAAVARPFLHGRTPRLFELAGGRLDGVSAKRVVEAARGGDGECVEAVRRVGELLGVATANVVTLLAPERIVVGGGLAGAADLLFPVIRESWERHARVAGEWLPSLVTAELDHPGVVGAALWARAHSARSPAPGATPGAKP